MSSKEMISSTPQKCQMSSSEDPNRHGLSDVEMRHSPTGSQPASPSPFKTNLAFVRSSQPGPKKSLFGDKSTDLSPAKCIHSPVASPGPAPKRPKATLSDFTSHMQAFQEEMDTKLKAMMFCMMVGEDAKDDVQKLRRTTSAFFYQSAYVLKDIQLNVNGLKQKLSSTEQYNLHLHRENIELKAQIKNLKKNLAEQSMKDIDVTVFTDDMEQEEKLDTDHLLPASKQSACADKGEEKQETDDETSGSSSANKEYIVLIFNKFHHPSAKTFTKNHAILLKAFVNIII